MVFGRDMVLPTGFGIGWDEAAKWKQKRTSESCGRGSKLRAGRPWQEEGGALAEAPKKMLRNLE